MVYENQVEENKSSNQSRQAIQQHFFFLIEKIPFLHAIKKNNKKKVLNSAVKNKAQSPKQETAEWCVRWFLLRKGDFSGVRKHLNYNWKYSNTSLILFLLVAKLEVLNQRIEIWC